MSVDPEDFMLYWRQMCSAAQSVMPDEDPVVWEDLAAKALTRALERFHRFDPARGQLWAWLSMLARYEALEYRKVAIRHGDMRLGALTEIRRATSDAGTERHVRSIAVHDALGQLPEPLARHAAARAAGFGVVEAGSRDGLSKRTSVRREADLRVQLRRLIRSEVAS